MPEEAPVAGWKTIELDIPAGTVRIPAHTQLDLGATAKAWAADRVADRVFGLLGCGVLVSLGGDVAVAGDPPPGGFRIGLSDVSGGPPTGGSVAISSGGLATSGIAVRQWRFGGRQVHHIIDPATSLPVRPMWRTVSVAAASCVDANTASTAAMVKGPEAMAWLAARNLPSRLVEWDGTVSCIADWPVDATEPRRRRGSMMLPTVAAVGTGSTAMWYLTRATGLVSLVLLSATVVLGVVASVGWTTERWPRFLSQTVHRNLSLFCLVLIGVHIVTTVADGYVPIGYLDAVIPFRTPYRPLWVGFGALAFDLLLAVAITSGLRRRIGTRAWRSVHWLAYVCWPIALLHGLGAGTDTRLSLTLLINVLCVVAVVGAVGWRLVTGRTFSPGRRDRRGGHRGHDGHRHRHRRGGRPPPSRVVTAGRNLSVGARPAERQLPVRGRFRRRVVIGHHGPTGRRPAGCRSAPFNQSVQGTYQTSAPNRQGQISVVLTMTAAGSAASPLVVTLNGDSVNGGVAMSSSQVTWGPDTGTVTALQGSTIGAKVSGPSGSVDLTMQLNLDQANGTVTGTVSGDVQADNEIPGHRQTRAGAGGDRGAAVAGRAHVRWRLGRYRGTSRALGSRPRPVGRRRPG